MMTSLFSMFDPTAIMNIPLNWGLMVIVLILLPTPMWKSSSRMTYVLKLLTTTLNMEFNSLFSKNMMLKGTTLLPISLFMFIMIMNLTSNFPYTFCAAAHLSFSLTLSIPIWTSIILFYWMNLTKDMMSHLVPTGTPSLLMPLMVVIELVSNMIRPAALAVRLTANLIAGHLLMALLGNTLNPQTSFWILIVVLQIIFLSFELMVALIQSYVFSVLMTLYSSEIN
uniref:ATP synthase subunit a n=1 Tax=Russelliana solanicola TaxID=2008469 RepID=A0A344A2R4_9HEMI|nr:ATP synthase F0 subunit 6 [Russelliana solanicola]AWU49055.1 ATP synthase F0 subunit 6 [Russelliana solanicola]